MMKTDDTILKIANAYENHPSIIAIKNNDNDTDWNSRNIRKLYK